METYLGRILEYNTWANRGLLDFLRDQPSETLDLAAAGVYGSIRETLESAQRDAWPRDWGPEPAVR